MGVGARPREGMTRPTCVEVPEAEHAQVERAWRKLRLPVYDCGVGRSRQYRMTGTTTARALLAWVVISSGTPAIPTGSRAARSTHVALAGSSAFRPRSPLRMYCDDT
jgi:hypothetical protein